MVDENRQRRLFCRFAAVGDLPLLRAAGAWVVIGPRRYRQKRADHIRARGGGAASIAAQDKDQATRAVGVELLERGRQVLAGSAAQARKLSKPILLDCGQTVTT